MSKVAINWAAPGFGVGGAFRSSLFYGPRMPSTLSARGSMAGPLACWSIRQAPSSQSSLEHSVYLDYGAPGFTYQENIVISPLIDIGPGAAILRGVHFSEGAATDTGDLAYRNISAGRVVNGNPARYSALCVVYSSYFDGGEQYHCEVERGNHKRTGAR